MVSLNYGDTEEVQLALLKRTTNVDHIDNSGLNALLLSIEHNSSEKVQLELLKRTTNVDQVNTYNMNTLMISLKNKTTLPVILELIKKAKITRNHINLAIKNNHGILVVDALVNELINQGC